MFGRWLKSARDLPQAEGAAELPHVIAHHLNDADEETIRVVTAIAGLLAGVAYADRDFSAPEQALVRRELGRVNGMTPQAVEAICDVLTRHIVELSTVQAPRYCRTLRELSDRELRVEVLAVLVELAAADGTISGDEVNMLRRTSTALGLSQDDYNAAQARHRGKLAALKS